MKNCYYVELFNGKPDKLDKYALYSQALSRIEHFEIDDMCCGEYEEGKYCINDKNEKLIRRIY